MRCLGRRYLRLINCPDHGATFGSCLVALYIPFFERPDPRFERSEVKSLALRASNIRKSIAAGAAMLAGLFCAFGVW